MATYPLPTLAATVSASGIAAPSYADILASLQASFRSIYGADAYLEPDGQDGQLLAVFATAIHDANTTAIAVYNAFSPATAQGAGLSNIVKINGLARLAASRSSANLLIVGQAGATIINGVVEDGDGNRWTLPPSVVIPATGQTTVTATAQALGDIAAGPGSITRIVTPTRGWQSVTNPLAAVPGAPVETDAALRRRQSISTSLPSLSVLGGIVGAVANLPGVSMLAAYENDGGTTNAIGIPGNSIALVVQGGDAQAIADMIAKKKAPGTGTHGTISKLVTDAQGIPATIKFFPPTQVTVTVSITIKALTGYLSSTGAEMANRVATYIGGLGIGAGDVSGAGKVYLSRVEAVAAMIGSGLEQSFNITGVTLSRGGNPAAADIPIAFNELAVCAPADITVTVA